jgi:Tfp pilus assembly protein PilF
MKQAIIISFVVVLGGCGGSGPSQAEGPKPDLSGPPAGSASSSAGAEDKGSPELASAHDALEAKDFKTARTKAEAVLAKNGKHAEANFIVGICDEADKKNDDAVTHYKAAIAADPKLLGASINLSALLVDMKQFDDAAEVAKAGLKLAKGSAELHTNLAYALKGKGDHATAAKSFANAVQLKPEDALLRLDYADELKEGGDKEGAQKQYKNVIAKAGEDVNVIAAAGIGLAQSGDPPGCVAAFDAAIKKKSSPDFLTERAICKHKAGDLAGARADLDESLKAKPTVKAHAAAAKYAEEAKDKKACKLHYAEVAKMAAGTKVEEEAKKGMERCK